MLHVEEALIFEGEGNRLMWRVFQDDLREIHLSALSVWEVVREAAWAVH